MCATHRDKNGETRPRWRVLTVLLLTIAAVWTVTYVLVRDDTARTDEPAMNVSPTVVPDIIVPPLAQTPTIGPTQRPTDERQQPKAVEFLPVTVGTDALGNRSVERLPRLVKGNGIQFPSPIDFNPVTYAWDNQSAKPGSARGVVILTAHAYSSNSTALGNRLAATLRAGDVISVKGAERSAQYRVVSTRTHDLVSYAEMAQTWLDPNIAPILSLTVCTNYNSTTGDWDSRIVWVAEPLK